MTIQEIEVKFGLPARVKFPVTYVDQNSEGWKDSYLMGYVERIITRKDLDRENKYWQIDPSSSDKKEFECFDSWNKRENIYSIIYLGKE